jgi:hypothetical protein
MNKSFIIFKNSTGLTCSTLGLIGAYMLILMISSIFFNLINLLIYKKANLITPVNSIMISLISLNLLATLIESPRIIYNGFTCNLMFNPLKSITNKLFLYFCATMETYLLISISIQRLVNFYQ